MSGLLKKEDGDINVDGKPIEIFENNQWKKKIGYATQERYIINDTIINNISLVKKVKKPFKEYKKTL